MSAVTGTGMSFPECLGLGPGLKVGFVFPQRVGGIEYMVIPFGAFEQIKFHETGFLFQIGGSGFPNFLEIFFVSLDNSKTVHGNVMTHVSKE